MYCKKIKKGEADQSANEECGYGCSDFASSSFGICRKTIFFLIRNNGFGIKHHSSKKYLLFEYFDSGNVVWLDDMPREVIISSEEQRKRNNTWIDRDEIFFRLRFTENMETEILRECIKLAKEYLPKRLETCSSKVNLHPFSCRVGNQRTRWGSCSCRGVISLNWRIILLPYELGNYVLYHELAHLRELNHSTAFWNLLSGMIPDARVRIVNFRSWAEN